MKPHSILLIIGMLLSTQSFANDSLERVLNERLSYMKDVARYKWLKELKIEDLSREAQVLDAAEVSGLQYNITVESGRHFFSLQIQAAKEIQRYWFQQWDQGIDEPTEAPDLRSEVRPKLIALGDQILAELSKPVAQSIRIQAEGLSTETANQLSMAVRQVSRYPNQLAQIVDSKTLRVGTTFDYEPFSFKTNGTPQGIDVDLGKDLALALGAKLILVETSWPTLMQDLHNGKFDIGMSGISINLNRQKTAFFSNPHHVGGKTPIVRCNDKDKYGSLNKIDQAQTRLVVNPGGTNQRFVLDRIQHAKVTVHEDNRTIFSEIIDDRQDVMVTDAIEVQLQANKHATLCAAMPGQTLTIQNKGFLLHQDIALKQYVDTWLAQRGAEGMIQATFDHYLTSQTR